MQALPIKLQKDKKFRDFLSSKLKELDTGVNQVSVATDKMELSEFAERYELPNEIIHDIEEKQNGIIILNGRYYIFSEEQEKSITFIHIKFEHSLNGDIFKFNMEEESDGTKRMLDLLPILFRAGASLDSIYIVDELDRSLHTKLSKYLISQFVKNEDDSLNRSQLLFTAHDVNLLDTDILRQEEIWFIEKNFNGETKLKPFSDFSVVKGQNILNDYLNGRFGAIPVIREGR